MTYGVGAALNNMSLVGQGLGQKADATNTMAKAADEEQRRNMQNEQAEAQRKAGNQQLGATGGAMLGMMALGGPWGALLGGVVGAAAGNLF